MRTMQEKILFQIDAILEEHDLEGVRDFWQSNSGTLQVQRPTKIATLFRIAMRFDTGTMSACILLHGEDHDFAHIVHAGKVEHRERSFFPSYHDAQQMTLFLNCIRAFARAASAGKKLEEVWP